MRDHRTSNGADRVLTENHLLVQRRARYFSLGGQGPIASLWIVCHGYGQLAESFLEHFRPTVRADRLIVAPEGLSRFYVSTLPHGPDAPVGASWMTREDRLSEIEDYVAYLDQVYHHVSSAHDAPLGVLGFSQGVATVVRWIARGSAHVDRAVLWAGSLPFEVDLAAQQQRGRLGALTLVRGARDELIPEAIHTTAIKRLRHGGAQVADVTFDGGHRLDSELLARLMETP